MKHQTMKEVEENNLSSIIKRNNIIMNARDRTTSVKVLVEACIEALKDSKRTDIKRIISDVLHFHVLENLETISEELRQI